MMSGIRGKNTKPELVIRRGLFAQGFRYRLHERSLPGRPDLVLQRYRAAIFVHGCFWHGHGCPLSKMPSSNAEFWRAKIAANRERDSLALTALRRSRIRTLVVWECALRGRTRIDPERIIARISSWLRSTRNTGEIRGNVRS